MALRRAPTPRSPDGDFMRDEIVDAGIGFDPDELRRCREGGDPRLEQTR